MSEKKTGLELLRVPFPEHQISKLPKPTKAQTEAVKADYRKGIRCQICGTWHHPDVIHLDYVGHAALTDRLLDADPNWHWEPLAIGQDGLPVIDGNGGMWIKLTVCNVTRLGYGDAQGKTGGDAMKERIGDALRNAAMRFGAALDLWHKGDLHIEEEKANSVELVESRKKISTSYAETLTVDRRQVLTMKAGEIAGLWEQSPDLAVNEYVTFRGNLDTDEQAAFKHFLDEENPKLRNGLLKHYKAMNEKAA